MVCKLWDFISEKNTLLLAVSQLSAFLVELHSKSERSVLALNIGPFRWVKFSPILESNLAPLNQGQYSAIRVLVTLPLLNRCLCHCLNLPMRTLSSF